QARLAMTDDEALDVLGEKSGSVARGLVSLADGWPAVIGLAAAAGATLPPHDALPETLERYFAEELFNRVLPSIQTPLTVLSLAPSLTQEVISAVLKADSVEDFVEMGVQHGFFVRRAEELFEMNPLVRRFLQSKIAEADRNRVD